MRQGIEVDPGMIEAKCVDEVRIAIRFRRDGSGNGSALHAGAAAGWTFA